MIPWEARTPIHSFYHKTVIFSLFLCLCILSSHCRPIYYNKGGEPVSVSGSHFTNNGSMVVRVIVSSSSSSSSSSSDTRFGEGFFPFSSFPTTPTTTTTRSSINPTTYHPELTLPPISRSVRAKSTTSPHSFSSSDDNIFSVFYRAFTEQGDKSLPIPGQNPRPNLQISFHPPPRPKPENNVSVNNNDGRIVSVVSQSRSVSAAAAAKPAIANGEILRLAPKSTPVPANVNNSPQEQEQQPRAEALTQPQLKLSNMDWQEKVWGQPEQQWGESMKIRDDHSEKVWGQPEKVWAEPERNWGEPEKVHWGDTLKVSPVNTWGKQQQRNEEEEEKAQSDQESPRIYEIPPDELDETQQGKFYELGEDEEAEPQELNLKESEVKAKVEEAQLASRSWELPELNTPVDHSLEMMSESVQVPQTHPNSANPNSQTRLRSAAGNGKAIDTENQSEDEAERPGKKFGYVLDSSDVRKYRVEERTPDGYIVGEYGVINHDNGFLRGVRYTADGTINPRLIHEALMKFLAL